MKHIVIILIGIAALVTMNACSSTADPRFRVWNQRTEKVNVQIQTTGGNTINLNDVLGGQTTSYQSAPEGTIVATAVIQNVIVSPTASFHASKGSQSTIVILVGDPPAIRIDQ